MALAYRAQPGELTSFCPECRKPLEAHFEFAPQGVFICKTCPAHGEIRDLFYRHPEMFERAMAYMKWHEPPEPNPNCPQDCGPCAAHASPHAILNIDLTNACNLHCPFCFAAAEKREEQFWPDRDQIRTMLETGIRNRGHMAGVQFSGGEPTLSPYFLDAISLAGTWATFGPKRSPTASASGDRPSSPCRPARPACADCICSSTAWTTVSGGPRGARTS